MLLAAAVAYYFVDKQIDGYHAEATINTGIMGPQGINMEKENPWIQEYQVKMHFDNLINTILSRKNLTFLGYNLLIHDHSESTTIPFRLLEDMPDQEEINFDLTDSEITDVINTIDGKLDSFDFSFSDKPEMQKQFNKLARIFKYDYASLAKYNIAAERIGESDNIKISFESENPELCAYAVNKFCEESIAYNKFTKQIEDEKDLDFASKELNQKKAELNSLRKELETYSTEKGIVNVKESAASLVAQQKELNLRREELANKANSLRSNINTLSTKLQAISDNSNLSDAQIGQTNTAVVNQNKMIKEMRSKLYDMEPGPEYDALEKKIGFYENSRDKLLEQHADNLVKEGKALDTKNTKEQLFRQKTDAELELQTVLERQKSIRTELDRIKGEQTDYVGVDAFVTKKQNEIELATKEYNALYSAVQNSKSLMQNTFFPLKILEYAEVPEKPIPKYKAIITSFAGIVGGVLTTVAILLMSFFDSSLNTPNKFEKYTDLSLISTLNKVNTKKLNLEQLFSTNGQVKKLDVFKESLRNIRFAIESSGAKKFLFTSTKKGEGKTFLIMTLAHALTLKNKKILLVDTNFKHNSLTQMSKESMENGQDATKLIGESDLNDDFISSSFNSALNLKDVDIIGNKGSYLSPSEVFAGKDFKNFIDRLEDQYDYIFFEGASLNNYSDSKELIHYVDKVIVVFAAESDLKQTDLTNISFLKNLGSKFMGGILNKVELKDLD